LELAESKDWKLLVCCLSAELEALRSAHELLLPAFGLSVSDEKGKQVLSASPDAESVTKAVDTQEENETSEYENDLEPPADLLKDAETTHTDTASRSEDDEPDPAWLLPGS
jgi:hypothetical protein